MPSDPKPASGLRLRLATFLFPPLGLLLLWRSSVKVWRKLVGTLGILFYSSLYAGVVIWLLVRFTGLEVEWRGGYVPRLTYRKTRPDYDALEQDRAKHAGALATPRFGSPGAATSERTNGTEISERQLASRIAAPGDGRTPWPSFRGPRGDGIYEREPILTNWPTAGLKPLWRQPVGGGYASFAIAEGFAFTIEQRRESEVVTAYDMATGREIWTNGWPAHFDESMGGDGPRATPAYSDGKVYALGAEGEFRCLDAQTGKTLWSHNIVAEYQAEVPTWAIAPSPLVIGDNVIVVSGAGHGKTVLCFDKKSGELRWSSLDDVTGYSSPMLVTLCGEPQILISCETRTVGLQPASGKALWEYPWQVLHNQRPIAQPVLLGTNRFALSAGYFTGCAAVELTRTQDSFTTRALWKNTNLKNKFTSSVYWLGHIYGLDEDILTCLDADTGQRKWKDGRYGYGQLLLASGHLIILSGEGELALVKASPERFQEIARFPAIHGKTWNHLAIADGKLLVRNSAEMACFQIGL
jgi:outer membrane protein assembly factor BamB